MVHTTTEVGTQRAFSVLPLELFLCVLDQLIGTRDGILPIAYGPSSETTQALRNLTLVSRSISKVATTYLYSYCLFLNNCTNYTRLRRTLGLSLGNHLHNDGKYVRNNRYSEEIKRYTTSAFISPVKTEQDGNATQLVRLREVIDIGQAIGLNLKRLAIDLQPIYASTSEVHAFRPHFSENNIFLQMPNLEEMIASYNVLDYFPYAPPRLKRLAITIHELKDSQINFCFSTSSLQTLILLRPLELRSADIDLIFSSYKGKSLDVILVDVNSNHRTPVGTRSWKNDDTVRVWEIDVPISFYGDEDELILCDNYIWSHGVQGTLWSQRKRRMASWADVQRRLAGPVHFIVDEVLA